MTRRRIALASFVASLTLCAVPSASADHHFASVSEVYPGATATPSNEFVELQMYAGGQNVFAGNNVDLTLHNEGTSTLITLDLDTDPPSGLDQRTILIGTAAADAQFSVTSDYTIPAAGDFVKAAGGAACFRSIIFGNIDCVGWGNLMNIGSLPGVTPPASPAGIPDTQSIQRSLAPGCATLLEAGDDTNNPAADFAPGAPSPRANTTAATETPCVPPGGTQGGLTTLPTTPATPAANGNGAKKKCKKAKKKGKKGAAAAACKKKKKKK